MRFLACVLTLWVLTWGSVQAEQRRLFVLHTNDIHGHIEAYERGGLEKIAHLVRNFRRLFPDQVVLLDGGDTSLGTPLSGEFHGKPTAEIMASMKYDAITLGNHEFNWGKEKMRALTQGMKTPVLCANLVTNDGSPPPYPPSTIIERNGVRIGVIGLVTPDTYRRAPAHATAGWTFLPTVTAFQSARPELGEVDLTLALTHIGLDADKKLAQGVPELDLIVGGHSHTPLHKVVYESQTPIVQAGCYGEYLGVLELTVDTEKKKTQVTGYTLFPFDSTSPNDKVAHDIVESYAQELRPRMAEVLAEVRDPLSKRPVDSGFDTPLGNFISDVFRTQARTDIALYNRGGVRFDMLAGPLKVETIYKLFPFDDPVVVLEARGDEIQSIIEQGTIDGEGPLSASGLESTISQGEVTDIRVQGKPLQADRTYTIATTSFLAGGGDGMALLARLRKLRTLPFTRDVLLEYLSSVESVEDPGAGRLSVED